MAAKGRVPYALLALMETLRVFPGQIPDLDAVFMLADFPCIRRKWSHGGAPPSPMFGYQARTCIACPSCRTRLVGGALECGCHLGVTTDDVDAGPHAAAGGLAALQGSVRHYDIPFPDHTFWGNEYQYLQVGTAEAWRARFPGPARRQRPSARRGRPRGSPALHQGRALLGSACAGMTSRCSRLASSP